LVPQAFKDIRIAAIALSVSIQDREIRSERRPDVLVIGNGRNGASGRLQDLTYSLLRDAPCPAVCV
jgi:hypothetical protein